MWEPSLLPAGVRVEDAHRRLSEGVWIDAKLEVQVRRVLFGCLGLLFACSGKPGLNSPGVDWGLFEASGDSVYGTRNSRYTDTYAVRATDQALVWAVPVASDLVFAHPQPSVGPMDVVLALQDKESIRLTALGLQAGEMRWTTAVSGSLDGVAGSSSSPTPIAFDGARIAVAPGERVVVLSRDDGSVLIDQVVPRAGPIRGLGIHNNVVDTNSVRIWTEDGTALPAVETYSSASVVHGDSVLGTDPAGEHWIRHGSSEPVSVPLPGPSRAGGWVTTDGAMVVAVRRPGTTFALVRVESTGAVSCESAINGVGVDGSATGATGSSEVPFVIETGAGNRRAVIVGVNTGVVRIGEQGTTCALMDAVRVAIPTGAGVRSMAGLLWLS